jgi:hypothetical protein
MFGWSIHFRIFSYCLKSVPAANSLSDGGFANTDEKIDNKKEKNTTEANRKYLFFITYPLSG